MERNYEWQDPEFFNPEFYYITARFLFSDDENILKICDIGYKNKCYYCGYYIGYYLRLLDSDKSNKILKDCCDNNNIQAIRYYSLKYKNEKKFLDAINLCKIHANNNSEIALRTSNYISIYNHFNSESIYDSNDELKYYLYSYALGGRGYSNIESMIKNNINSIKGIKNRIERKFLNSDISEDNLMRIILIIKNKYDLRIKKIFDILVKNDNVLFGKHSKIFYDNKELVKKKYRNKLLQYHYNSIDKISEDINLNFDITKNIYSYI